MFLCKTKLHGVWASKVRDQLGFTGGVHVDSNGKSGGLLLLLKDNWEVTILSFSNGHIDACKKMEIGSNGDSLGSIGILT